MSDYANSTRDEANIKTPVWYTFTESEERLPPSIILMMETTGPSETLVTSTKLHSVSSKETMPIIFVEGKHAK